MIDLRLGDWAFSEAELYQEIAETARRATGSHVVYLYWFDRKEGRAVRIASSVTPLRVRLGLREIQRTFPDFFPDEMQPDVTVNPLVRQVFYEGRAVRATLDDITEGLIDPQVLASIKSRIGIEHVFMTPLIWNGQVFAALVFHHSECISRATEAICKAFARQLKLTVENAYLLTESRRQVDELRRSRALLAEAEEELRKKVAEFLHGQVQSHLLVAWHRLGEACELVHTDPDQAAALIEESRRIIDQMREEDVRKLSHLLHPAVIQVGLIPALRSLADSYRDQLEVHLVVDSQVSAWDRLAQSRISERVRLTLYRAVEEALINTCRHGQARVAEVRLQAGEGTLRIAVQDDGVGLKSGPVNVGLGLGSIDARLSQLGGRWDLQNNRKGRGATLTVEVPLSVAFDQAVS